MQPAPPPPQPRQRQDSSFEMKYIIRMDLFQYWTEMCLFVLPGPEPS